jgi:hypothetical protein
MSEGGLKVREARNCFETCCAAFMKAAPCLNHISDAAGKHAFFNS